MIVMVLLALLALLVGMAVLEGPWRCALPRQAGIFGSKKKSTTVDTTNITTSTTTNIRDIGLSGAAAIELAEVIGSTGVALAQINAETQRLSLTEQGKAFSELRAGSSALLASGERIVDQAASAAAGETGKAERNTMLVVVAALGVIAFVTFGGKRR